MIDLHYWPTPNGWKVTIFLEECGLPYRVIPVNIGRGDQHTDQFRRINPNGRIPAIVDSNPADGGAAVTIFESGAILQYLAEKTGMFIPQLFRERYAVLQWVFWQVGGLGPMAGQLSHFVNYAPEKMAYPLERYRGEYVRLLAVMNKQLERSEFLAGDYSIADMAAWPWLTPYKRFEVPLDGMPHLLRWHDTVKTREGVRRGVNVGKEMRTFQKPDEEARTNLFRQAVR